MRENDPVGDTVMRPDSAGGVIVDAGGDPVLGPPRDARDVAEAVAAAAASGERLRIQGGGSWMHAGRPTPTDRTLNVSALSGIVEYVPGDLTLTALAATPLAAINAATRPHSQWLPLDAFGSAKRTLGATLATASTGPLGASIGLPRDLTLGIDVVTGRAELVRGGGRVVKNVAGYDLVRLQVGAWGTLGVITEATVRLRGLPESDLTLALVLPAERTAFAALLNTLRRTEYATLAAELLTGALASRIGAGDAACIIVRLAGNQTQVAAQRAVFASLGDCMELDTAVWSRLREGEPPGATVFRVSSRPSELGNTWHDVAADDTLLCHASLERGIVRCVSTATDTDAAQWIARAGETRRIIIESAPHAIWATRPATNSAPLNDGMRRAFDPAGVLNPGILGGER